MRLTWTSAKPTRPTPLHPGPWRRTSTEVFRWVLLCPEADIGVFRFNSLKILWSLVWMIFSKRLPSAQRSPPKPCRCQNCQHGLRRESRQRSQVDPCLHPLQSPWGKSGTQRSSKIKKQPWGSFLASSAGSWLPLLIFLSHKGVGQRWEGGRWHCWRESAPCIVVLARYHQHYIETF